MGNALALFLHYFPFVLQAVVAVEKAAAGVPGASKKQIAMSSIQAAAAVGATVDEQHVKVVSALIDSTVAALKDTGIFGPATPAAIEPQP